MQELNAQTENNAPIRTFPSPAENPDNVSKNKASGKKAGKVLLLVAFFCFLLYGGWPLTQGDSPYPPISFGDAEELGSESLSGAEELAVSVPLMSSVQEEPVQDNEKTRVASESPQETTLRSSPESSPEKVQRGSLTAPPAPSENFTNSVEMEFVLIPAGEFLMGSPETETDRQQDESPLHRVQIENSFYLGKYEVSLEEWQKVMETETSSSGEPGLPATNISWEEARVFVSKLNVLEGTDRYRLPSEAEWEYACRAKSTAKFSFGDDNSKLSEYAWWKENSDIRTPSPHPAGLKKANSWGLYDMHGNAWEWVEDSWYADYSEASSDGRARENEDSFYRIARGGSLKSSSSSCRVANRAWFSSDVHNSDMGFRVLMEV